MIKRIALRSLLLPVILVLLLTAPARAAEDGDGTIEGQLVNGTGGSSSSVADQEITLKKNLNDSEEGSAAAKTDAEGRFSFEGLSTGSGYSYQVTLTYQEAEYDSELLSFDEGETTKSIEINVYDSTISDEAIAVMMAHTVIYVEPGSLLVKEYFLFVNNSDRTYVGSKEIGGGVKETLAFSLPEEATDLQPTTGLMSWGIYRNENGFVDTLPVLPGGKELAYAYRVSNNSDKYTFSREVNYPTINYDLLVQSGVGQVLSGQLTQQEALEIGGIQFNHFSGSDFSPGETLVVQLSGISGAGSHMAITWVAVALAVLIAGFISIYILRKRRPRPVRLENDESQRHELLVELAQLDDEFDSGKISEEVYHRLRAEKKSQLVALIQRQKKSRDNG